MPVDERTFVADVKGWIDAILRDHPGLPYSHARVEEHTIGGRQRHDLVLYGRDGRPVLSGEVKMPDSVIGKKNPYHEELVRDAFEKATNLGVDYYFTWNVRDFALFQTQQAGVPWNERKVAGRHVVDVIDSDDVRKAEVEEEIKQFWVTLLESLPAHFAGRRVLRELALDELFIRRIEAALEEPIESTKRELGRRHKDDEAFRSSIVAWMVEQGWEDTGFEDILGENLERAARLSCYVLMTRLVFYEVLRKRFRVVMPLAGIGADSPEAMSEILEARFDDAMRYSRDYETVFAPKEFGSTLPLLAPDAHLHWMSVIRRIEEFDFSRLDFDVIGQLYEKLIGHDERRQYGQFYTSPDVVDLINAFCIRRGDAMVLDPACGGGTFLVRAYARKQALARREGQRVEHRRVLEEIYGVDRATFPAQLSTINLAVRSITNEQNYPRVGRRSFFDVQQGVPLTKLPVNEAGPEDIFLPALDAVVGNPPYIRQERVDPRDKQVIENLARKEWPGSVRFSGRSDIYVHFFAHAASFLKPGGYLGFVTSIGWLDTDYGFRLQEFFLQNFRIVAVLESQVEKWFEDARVTTAVTILQRETDAGRRIENKVRFIQLLKPLSDIYTTLRGPIDEKGEDARQGDLDAVRDLIEEISASEKTDYWRVKVVSQRELWERGCRLPETADDEADEDEEGEEGQGTGRASAGSARTERTGSVYRGGKWGQYIRAPDVWFELLEAAGATLVPLHELAAIKRGFTSGADKFYCVRDVTDEVLKRETDEAAFYDKWTIKRADTKRVRIVQDGEKATHLVEAKYLEPEFHTLMEAKSIVIRTADVGRLVINAPVSRAALRNTHLARYVRYAEEQGWHTGATVASRARVQPWYDLGLRPKGERAQLFWPKSQQYRHIVPWNEESLPGNDNVYDVWARDSVPPRLLWAMLNSTVVVLSKHQFGRAAGVEGNLKTEVVDVNMMLVPDVRQASQEAGAKAIAAVEAMAKRLSARYLYDEFTLADRQQLDDAVLEMLGYADLAMRLQVRTRLYEAIKAMQIATREREIIAQQDRARTAAGGRRRFAAVEIAEDIWAMHSESLGLLQFPGDFLPRAHVGETFDLPAGEVEVGMAMMETGRQLRAGTVRVGGPAAAPLEVGGVARGRFLQAMAECGHYGPVLLPDEATCEAAYQQFRQYRGGLEQRFVELAAQRSNDKKRQDAIAEALLRKALTWRRPD